MRFASAVLTTILAFAYTSGPAATKSFRELTAKADADLDAGNLDTALEEYNQIIATNLTPQLASLAVMRRGSVYYAKHDIDRAMADYDQALRLDPNNAAAYDNRANALDARGDWDDALKDYNESARLNPRNSYVYLNRATLWTEHGNFNAALADFAKTLSLNPREEAAHIGRANIYLMQCKRETALKEANAAIAIAPGQALVYLTRADVYSEMRRYAEAEADIHRAMHLKAFDKSGSNFLRIASRFVMNRVRGHLKDELSDMPLIKLGDQWQILGFFVKPPLAPK